MRRWKDLSRRQRTAVGVGGAIQMGLLLAALTDLRRRPSEQVRGSKAMWAAISFVNFIGPAAYLLAGRRR